MRVLLFTVLVPLITAFAPAINTKDHRGISTELHDMNRRKAFTTVASAAAFTTGLVLGFPESSKAFSQQLDDHLVEPTQLPTDGKLDLNSAYVGDYMALRGMYPRSAGKIASHGPYTVVKDIYKIEGLSDHDLTMFKKYETLFTVNPPGRAFKERINARVST